jgi:ATP-dependent DNA helicase DinG
MISKEFDNQFVQDKKNDNFLSKYVPPSVELPQSYNFDDFAANFPFDHIRDNQKIVFQQIANAFNSGYKYVILEAPTGFGKSAEAVTAGLTLGTSYILTSTKDLQAQYKRDFPFIRTAKGAMNFSCLAIEDLIGNNKYCCDICDSSTRRYHSTDNCKHTTVEYGLCRTREHGFENPEESCKYKTDLNNYIAINRGTKEERIIIPEEVKHEYKSKLSEWSHVKRLPLLHNVSWQPCKYFDQLYQAYSSSISVWNYPMFLAHLSSAEMKSRQLLVLDEGHLLEKEIVEYASLTISNKRWRRYIPGLNINNINLDSDVKKWLPSLIKIETRLLLALGYALEIEELAKKRFFTYGYVAPEEARNTKITYFLNCDLEKQDAANVATSMNYSNYAKPNASLDEKNSNNDYYSITNSALRIEAGRDLEKLSNIIDGILLSPKNWIVIENILDAAKTIILKPLNIASYCPSIFSKGSKVLIMSATILDDILFCKSLGLPPEDTLFIRAESDFPVTNRPIYSMRVYPLNYRTLEEPEVRSKIAGSIDEIMDMHKDDKGIIHTTSYTQNNFISRNLSQQNVERLISTDPSIPREQIVLNHINSGEPTVLISPSLYMGIDLKGDLSRFQIITKVPYPDLSDRWINAKIKNFDNKMEGEKWYSWQTALRLVQAYGRSIRSKQDWAITYIIDSNFNMFVRKNMHLFPKWFLSAIQFRQVRLHPLRLV